MAASLSRAAAWGAALLLLTAAALTGVVYVASEVRLTRRYEPAIAPLEMKRDARNLERGRHLAEAVAQCGFCHGDDLGGKLLVDTPWVGRLYASNLTSGRGGAGRSYSDSELVRSIRHGVARDGRPLILMPSHYFWAFGDEDLAALIAYIRSVPPVDAELPGPQVGPLARLTLVLGLAADLLPAEHITHEAPRRGPPRSDAGAAYGEYLVDVAICRVCHHADLTGGLHPLALPGEPPPPDLTPAGALAGWSEVDFLRAMRSGVTPDGRRLDHEHMPWPRFALMRDEELRAIRAYLTGLPTRP